MSMDPALSYLCPYCSSQNELTVDITGGSCQTFVTDCETCCAPILIKLRLDGSEVIHFEQVKENE